MASELDLLLLTAEESPRKRRGGRLPRRQAVGILLIFALLMTGRVVRQTMLLGPDDKWRDPLWLDQLLPQIDAAAAAEAGRKKKPELTSPLPINTCSRDSLTLLPGVGKVMAARIAAVRDSGIVFASADDLKRVKGIGPRLSARLAPLVVFGRPVQTDSASAAQSE